MSPEQLRARSNLGIKTLKARKDPTPENLSAVDDARVRYRVVTLEEHIRAVVDSAPPIPPAARDRLALLLRPAS